MIRPDDDSKSFQRRWNTLVRILLVESSVKLVARTAMDYADWDDGSSCHPSNERLARETGYNERTVRDAWAVLRGLDMAERVRHGVPHKGIADEYQLVIPSGWDGLPILGPHGRKFTCVSCSDLFTPQGNCTLNERPGDKPGSDTVRFDVRKFCFCPRPRRVKGRDVPWCADEWSEEAVRRGLAPWKDLKQNDRWKLFREARSDDW